MTSFDAKPVRQFLQVSPKTYSVALLLLPSHSTRIFLAPG